jgi:hypothetical protein
MPIKACRLVPALPFLILAGCATGPRSACDPARVASGASLDRDHAARVAATEDEPAQGRTPGDKGPSPEGIEAIALLEKEILDSRQKDCTNSHP